MNEEEGGYLKKKIEDYVYSKIIGKVMLEEVFLLTQNDVIGNRS